MLLVALAAPAGARDHLGVFGQWAAFRDPQTPRCYAITAASGRAAQASAYASVGTWPRRQVRGQVHIRLSRPLAEAGTGQLQIGRQSFRMAGSGHDLWAADPAEDGAIIAAMRGAQSMRLTTRDATGRRLTERYSLDGVATALDAAAIGCARR